MPSNIARRRKNAQAEGSEDYASKRAELVAIAAQLFKERGLKATTLADIAEKAGLDRATVYYYVGSKQELFQSSIEGCLDDYLRGAERLLLDKGTSPKEKLQSLVTLLMTSYHANYPQMYVFIQEQMQHVSKDPSPWAKEIQRKTRRLDTIVRDIVALGIESGKLRSDVDPTIAARALFGMVNWTHRWYRPGSAASPESIAETFSTIFFEGMQQKGR